MKKLVAVFSLFFLFTLQSIGQCITVDGELQDFIDGEKAKLDDLKSVIEDKVNTNVLNDVYLNGNNQPSYENWLRFIQVADDIEELNEMWDSAYAAGLTAILERAYELGLGPDLSGEGNSEEIDCAEESIENDYFVYPEEYASVYFEGQLNFTSYRALINQNVADWLADTDPQIDQDPSLVEELDEEFWTCITLDKEFEIRDPNVDENLLDGYLEYVAYNSKSMLFPSKPTFGISLASIGYFNYFNAYIIDWDKVMKIVTRIKDIAIALAAVIAVAEGIRAMMSDCAESQQANVNQMGYDGFVTNSNDRMIGYKLEQKSVTFDLRASNTKIRGKAKLYKLNNNGKIKGKDRRGKVGIEFCTRQWDVCNKVDYPVDANLIIPVPGFKEKAKKVKLTRNEGIIPFAIAPTKSIHFLSFSFFHKGNYERTIPVLAIGTPVTTRCR